MLERYVALAKMGRDDSLFFMVLNMTLGPRLHPSGGLSYVRELVMEKLAQIGLDKSKYSLHSLWSGEASTAANAGVPDRWFKWHGRLRMTVTVKGDVL